MIPTYNFAILFPRFPFSQVEYFVYQSISLLSNGITYDLPTHEQGPRMVVGSVSEDRVLGKVRWRVARR